MRETRTSGSEGGEPQANGTSLPLSFGLVWLDSGGRTCLGRVPSARSYHSYRLYPRVKRKVPFDEQTTPSDCWIVVSLQRVGFGLRAPEACSL